MSVVGARRPDSLAELRDEAGMVGELPYWDFVDGFVVLADGSLATAYRLHGVDVESWDDGRINQLAQDLRGFLNGLPDRCEVAIACEVAPLPNESAVLQDHDLTLVIDRKRAAAIEASNKAGAILQRDLSLVIYRRFTKGERTGFSWIRSLVTNPVKFVALRRADLETAIQELRQTATTLTGSLGATGVRADRIPEAEVVGRIYSFLNPMRSKELPAPILSTAHREQEFTPGELEVVPQLSLPSPREQLAFADVVHSTAGFVLDGMHHRVITLKTLPEYTHASMMTRLMSLQFPHTVILHIQVPEQAEELRKLQARRRMAHSLAMGTGGRAADLENEAKLQSTETLLRELLNSGQKIFYAQLAVLLRSERPDVLASQCKDVLARFREMAGAEATVESAATFRVWKTMLPAGCVAPARARRIKTDNLADLLPIYEPYRGLVGKDGACVLRSRTKSLVFYDPYHPSLPNYNVLVTGSSGSGKSFLNNLILLQNMVRRPLTFVIDVGGSYRKLCEYFNGQYVDISPADAQGVPLAINPFELAPGETEASPRKIKFLMALLETLLSEGDTERLGKLNRSLLEEAVIRTYEVARRSGASPRLSDLAKTMAESEEASLRDFAKMLFPWTGDRAYGRLLDRPNALDLRADLVVFDLKGLSSYPDLQSAMMLIITDFILTRVESRDPALVGRQKQILMDEAWELLKNGAAASFMEYCVRTLRKTGSGITFITQGLDEIVQSSVGGAILSNTATKFILRQRGDLDPVRRILKLNDREVSLLGSLKQAKGEYSEAFLLYGDDKTIVRAVPSPLDYWLASSDPGDNALLDRFRSEHFELTLAEALDVLAEQYPRGAAGGMG